MLWRDKQKNSLLTTLRRREKIVLRNCREDNTEFSRKQCHKVSLVRMNERMSERNDMFMYMDKTAEEEKLPRCQVRVINKHHTSAG